MVNERHLIYGVHLANRIKGAPRVQELLTQYGCNIRTRIGLHQVTDNLCSHQGLILLEMFGDPTLCDELAAKLRAIEGVEVQSMLFEHPEG